MPAKKVKSKRFITKVMFLCPVPRPRYDTNSRFFFDVNIGMWPFTEKRQAIRSSRNRPAGKLDTKAVSVEGETYKE